MTHETVKRAAPRAMVAIALLAMIALGFGRATTVSAQDATPMASPVVGPCDAPALPPGTPTPMEATPEHDMSAMATPEAAPAEATPEAPAPEGTPADEATTAAATAAIENIVNCLNGGNYEGVVALMTPNATLGLFGTDNPYDVLAGGFLEGTVFANLAVSDVQTYADGRLSAQVDYFQSQYQFLSERWWLIEDAMYWKLDGTETLAPEPEGDTVAVGVTMSEYSFVPNVTEIPQLEVVLIHGINAGVEMHEIVIFRFPEGTTVEDIAAAATDEATGEAFFGTAEFVGASFYEPGQEGDIALVGLEPGTYTLVCFIPGPDGTPHIASGMITQVTVVAPTA